ncbi:phage tail protein [Pseudomonas sp. BRG-100]|uniref:phage tail-collar fiber domain-containing protein n=1 Tax=Pseudomonas sp. BRG-100 TaxID=1524267 RepID=UPI0004E6E3C9|nr:phage tail protein [Pseudomonas sp. BRG-100]KFF45472.1 phage tail protein [Pseudomonas sp. BRG-100]
MGASITLAGESLIAHKLGSKERLDVVRFVFANVPGLDPNAPVDRGAAKPPAAQIVHTYAIPPQNIGFVNPNQVVYSSMLGSDIGDFDWNWIGLETAENVLLAVAYVPLQQKRKNIPPLQLGNNVTRNILVVFDGAQALTGVTIDASTWQHDFTVRLKGIDERERLSNRDVFGRACFFGAAFQVEKVGQGYQLAPGLAYIEGVRIQLSAPLPLALPAIPVPVWLHVALRRELNDVVATWRVVFDPNQVDYVDSAGTQYFCISLASITSTAITDHRTVEPITGPLIQYLAARNGDYQNLRARATTKGDVGLSNVPNAISDDDDTNSSSILATTKAVYTARWTLQNAINKLINGVTPAGKAKQLETARRLSVSGAATGSATFDGTADATIAMTLADTGVVPGTYTKVLINAKGLVYGNERLVRGDIPALDWSIITTGKPTTLDGYGITNALPLGTTDKRPQLYAPVPGRTYTSGALEIREAQLVYDAQRGFDYAPRMIFHWATVVAGDLAMAASGQLCWNGSAIWHSGSFDPNTKADKATTLAGYGIKDAIQIGKYGLASNVATEAAIDTIGLPGGFYYFGEGATSFSQYAGLVNIPYGSGEYAGQIGFVQGRAEPRVLIRSVTNTEKGWTPTREVWHTGNLNPSTIVPAGAIVAFAMDVPPTGYLKANGALVSRAIYADLFAQISTYYGAGDGVSTFALPDLRAVFVRGADDSRGVDPGRNFGSLQSSQNASHSHTATSDVQGEHSHGIWPIALNIATGQGAGHYSVGANLSANSTAAGAHSHNITVNASGGNESRPINVAMMYCIKY